jgi:hypothetical protein
MHLTWPRELIVVLLRKRNVVAMNMMDAPLMLFRKDFARAQRNKGCNNFLEREGVCKIHSHLPFKFSDDERIICVWIQKNRHVVLISYSNSMLC